MRWLCVGKCWYVSLWHYPQMFFITVLFRYLDLIKFFRFCFLETGFVVLSLLGITQSKWEYIIMDWVVIHFKFCFISTELFVAMRWLSANGNARFSILWSDNISNPSVVVCVLDTRLFHYVTFEMSENYNFNDYVRS